MSEYVDHINTVGFNIGLVQSYLSLMEQASHDKDGDLVSDELGVILCDALQRLDETEKAAQKLWEGLRERLVKEGEIKE